MSKEDREAQGSVSEEEEEDVDLAGGGDETEREANKSDRDDAEVGPRFVILVLS